MLQTKRKNIFFNTLICYSLFFASCNSEVTLTTYEKLNENNTKQLEPLRAPINDLTITVNSSNSLTLNWKAGDSDTTGYKIAYYKESETNTKAAATNCEYGSIIEPSNISGTSHTLTGLSYGAEYIFRVCAINKNGEIDNLNGIQISEFTNFSDSPLTRTVFENHSYVGSTTTGVITAINDYDGDGHDDIVKNIATDDIHILSGKTSQVLLSFNAFHGLFKEIGDYNNDGTGDFIVTQAYFSCGAGSNCGRFSIHSGADGSLIYNKEGTVSHQFMGRYIDNLGDKNSDGHDDVLLFYNDRIEFISGADNSVLHTQTSPHGGSMQAASVIGDYNNDGFNDYAVNNNSYLVIYSGANNSVLADLNIYTLGSNAPAVDMEDFNSDGHDDVLISDYKFNADDGRFLIISGADNSILLQVVAPAGSEDELGKYELCLIPDLNNDGKKDIYAETVAFSPNSSVFSGTDGTPLVENIHYPTSTFDAFYECQTRKQFFDLNNDGKYDFQSNHMIISF